MFEALVKGAARGGGVQPVLQVGGEVFARRAVFGEVEGFVPVDASCCPVGVREQVEVVAQGGELAGVGCPFVGERAEVGQARPVEHEEVVGKAVAVVLVCAFFRAGQGSVATAARGDVGAREALQAGGFFCCPDVGAVKV